VTTAAQPNITSVGTLTGLTVSGTVNMTGNTAVNIGSSTNYGGLLSVNRVQTSSIADLLTLRDASNGAVFNLQTFGDPAAGTVNRFNYTGAYLTFRQGTTETLRLTTTEASVPGTLTATGQIRAASGQSRDHFYRFSEGDMGGQYVHMKTNAFRTQFQMYAVRFEGHDYSGAKAILCSLGWYQYAPSDGPINIGGTGSNPVGAYKAADGFTVIRIQTGGYFTAFTLSQMTTTQGLADLVITAARSTNSPTGAY